MRSALIVANRTVGGSELIDAVKGRLANDEYRFHLMVPVTSSVSTSIALGSMAVDTMPMESLDLPNEREKADERLKFGLDWLAELGVSATGEVITDADTVAAVCRVVNERSIDEVIISTLPTTLSRWLRQDLPHRIERKVSVPVTVVTSKSAP
jgi:cell pole-organizing protein PopZ